MLHLSNLYLVLSLTQKKPSHRKKPKGVKTLRVNVIGKGGGLWSESGISTSPGSASNHTNHGTVKMKSVTCGTTSAVSSIVAEDRGGKYL